MEGKLGLGTEVEGWREILRERGREEREGWKKSWAWRENSRGEGGKEEEKGE